MLTVYGIRNCDSCRKALAWLGERSIAHHFHDLRGDGLDDAMLVDWIAALGWGALLNRRGATWRGLPAIDKVDLDAARAQRLMLRQPTLIKRPIFALGELRLVGFGEAERQAIEAAH